MQKLITKLILLSFLFFACKSKDNADKDKGFSVYPSAGLVDSVFRFYDIQGLESYLDIKSLRKGVDSFEIRIYTINSISSIRELFTIKSTRDSLIKKHYTVQPQSDEYIDYKAKNPTKKYVGNFNIMHQFSFKKSDTSFINLFQELRIDTLPTQGFIPNFKSKKLLDGGTYIIEIATKKSYRCLMYSNPESYKESKQNVCFSSFLSNFYGLLNVDELDWYKNNSTIKALMEIN